MKDYKLSEIKDICKYRKANFSHPCDGCEFWNVVCDEWTTSFETLDIEPRDMIELPCKQYITTKKCWFVYYRDKAGDVLPMFCGNEAEADEFLAGLKGNKK